jgi:hypothetical protein
VSLPVMLAVAVAIVGLAFVAIRVWAHRSGARPERLVTEADARARVAAHAERPVGDHAVAARQAGRGRRVGALFRRYIARLPRLRSSGSAHTRLARHARSRSSEPSELRWTFALGDRNLAPPTATR